MIAFPNATAEPNMTDKELFEADAPYVVGMPMRAAVRSLHRERFEVLTMSVGKVARQEVGTTHGLPKFIWLVGTRLGGRSVCPDFFMTCALAP